MQLKLLAWSILQLQGRVRYWQMGLICFYDVACPESDLKGQYIPWTNCLAALPFQSDI